MRYKVLALKWRPQSFDDVIGQNHVTQTLSNAFEQNRIGQGYIFTGPRGVGKTTTARILAMALNAENGPSVKFDPKSNISKEIANSRSMDVLEIDGASNRGIEEIRSLRERIKFQPMNCTYKVIIIDEVHMLTNQAFNALLRTLEEPPEHVKFIFATTDIHKIPQTIISRCQRFDFNRISLKAIKIRLSFVLKEEKIEYDSESLNAISKKADGSMRDALSILEQVIAFCGNRIKYESLTESIGLIPSKLYFSFTSCIKSKNYPKMLKTLDEFSNFGIPAPEIINGFSEHIRNLIYASVEKADMILEMNDELKKEYIEESTGWKKKDLLIINQVLIDASSDVRKSNTPYLLLEMTLIKLLEMDSSVQIEELLSIYSNDANKLIKNPSKSKTPKESSIKDPFDDKVKSSRLNQNHESVDQLNKNKLDGDLSLDNDTIVPNKESNKNNLDSDLSLENDKIVQNKKFNKKKLESDLSQDNHTIIPNKESNNNLEFSIDKIIKLWSDIIREINISRPSIGSIIEECKPVEINNDTLVLKYLPDSSYNESLFNRAIPFVQEIIFKHFKRKIKLKISKNQDLKKTQKKPDPSNDKNNEKIFNKIIDVFDGEIIR